MRFFPDFLLSFYLLFTGFISYDTGFTGFRGPCVYGLDDITRQYYNHWGWESPIIKPGIVSCLSDRVGNKPGKSRLESHLSKKEIDKMIEEENKKPVVKLYMTKNPLECNDLFNRNCIAWPVIKALQKAGLEKQEQEFRRRYNSEHRVEIPSPDGFGSPINIRPMFFYEFLRLASLYVTIEMYDDFRRYIQDCDESSLLYITEGD